MEENKPLRRSTRILKKIEQQAVGTSTVDELSIAVTQNLVQIKEALDEKILDLQKLFDVKLSVIRGAFDATIVDIHPEPRLLDNTSKKTTQFPDTSPIFSSLETTTTSFADATFTGTISTILPLPSSVANTNLTFNFNNNNDDTEFLTYEEEVYYSISYDDLLLSNEDQAFVDSIQNPTFSGICLSSPTDYSSLSFPTISGLDESAAVPEVLTIISQESTSCTSYLIVIASYLLVDYVFKIELIICINYQYRIFFWDPGIYFSYVQQ